jgi:hypothetical protein
MTKQEAISKVEQSFPSIWSREDVLSLINQIDEGNGNFDKDKLLDKIRDAVDTAINGMSTDDIVDTSGCEFEIYNGNEIRIDSVEVNTSDIVDAVMRDVAEVIEELVEEEND